MSGRSGPSRVRRSSPEFLRPFGETIDEGDPTALLVGLDQVPGSSQRRPKIGKLKDCTQRYQVADELRREFADRAVPGASTHPWQTYGVASQRRLLDCAGARAVERLCKAPGA